MITAVQSFKANNFKANSTNYNVRKNAMSNVVSFNQVADSFTKSNKVSFKGNFAKVGEDILEGAGSKFGSRARRFASEAVESISGAARNLTGKGNKMPITETPKIAPVDSVSQQILNAAADYVRKNPGQANKVQAAIDAAKKGGVRGNFTTNGDQGIKDAIGMSNVHFGDLVPDAVGETARQVGSEIASSTAGEAVKTLASEAGQYVTEELIGEAGMQAIERGLDAVAPGLGVAITTARYARRAYKVAKISGGIANAAIEKADKLLSEKPVQSLSDKEYLQVYSNYGYML